MTEAGEKKVEVGSDQVIQFCEVGGSGDKGDRQTDRQTDRQLFLNNECCGGGEGGLYKAKPKGN